MAVEKLCLFGASLLFCFSILEATSTEAVPKLEITYIQPVEPDQIQYLVVKPKYEEANIHDTTVDHTRDTEDVENVSAIENRFLAPQITTPNRDISDDTTPESEKISSVVPTLQIEDTSEATNILNPSVHVKRMNTVNSIENEVKTASLDDTLFESLKDENFFNDQYAIDRKRDENSEGNGQDSGQYKSDSLLGMSIPDEQSVYEVVQTKQLDSNQDYTIVNSDSYSSELAPNDGVIYTDAENNIEYPDTIKLHITHPDKETTCVCFNNKLKYLNEIINSVIQKTATVNYKTIDIPNENTDYAYENLNEYQNIRGIVPEYYTNFQPANNIAPVNTETYNYPDDKQYFINLNDDSAYNTQNYENNNIVMKYIVYNNQYRHENFNDHYTVLYKIINDENVENILENDVQVQNIILNKKINVDSVFNYVLKRYLLHTFINYFQQILHFRGVTDVEHVSKVFNNFIKYIVRLQLVGYTEPKIQQILTYLKLYLINLIEKQHQRETQLKVNNIDYIENYYFDDNKNINPIIIFSNDDTKSRFMKLILSSSEFSNKNVDYSNLNKYYTAIEDIINNRSTEYDLMIKNLMKNLNIDIDAIYKSVLEQFNRNKLIIYCQKMLYNEGITDTTYVWKVHNNFVNYVVYLYLTGFTEPEIRDVITYIKLYLMNFIETPDKNKFEDNTSLAHKDEIFKIKEHEAEDISVPNDDVKEKLIQYILSNNKFVDENYAYEQLNNHYTIVEEIINNKNIENDILIIKQRRIDVNLLYKYINEQYKLSAFKDYFERLLSKRGVITDERYLTNVHNNFVKYISQLHLEGYTESQIRNVIMYTKLYLVISIENQTQHQFDIRRLLSYIYEILYKKYPWLFGYNENHQQAIQDIILKHVLLIKHNEFIDVYEINTEKRANYIANIENEILNYVRFNNLENYEEAEGVGENKVYYMQSSENKITQDNVKEISIKYILSDDRIRNKKFGYDHIYDVYTEIENIINNKGMEHDLPIKTLTENGKADIHSIDKSLLDQYNLSEYKYYFQKLLSTKGITDVGMILGIYDNFVTYILKLQFDGYTQSEMQQLILYIKLYLVNLIQAQNNPYEDKLVYETDSEFSDDDNNYNANKVIYVANESKKDKLIQHILTLDKIPGENIGYNELKKHYIVLEDIINNNEGVQNDLQIENLIKNREIDVESSYEYISNLYDLNKLKNYFQTFLFERAITDTNYVTKVYDNFIKYILKLHLFGYTESHIRRVVTYVKLYLLTFITADDGNQIDDNAISVDNNGYVDTNLNYETKDYNINGYTTGNLKDKIAQYILSNKEVNGDNVEYNDIYKYYTIVEDIINNNKVLETDLEIVNYLFHNRDIDYNIIDSVYQTIYEQYKLDEFKRYFRVLLKSRGVTDELYLSKVHDNFVKYIFKLHLAGYNELQIRRAITYMKFYMVILLRRPVVNQSK